MRMPKPIGSGALLVALSGAAAPLAGQATGVPLRQVGPIQGLVLGADFGLGRVSRPGEDDKSRAVAVSGSVGFGPLGLSLGVARTTIDPAVGSNRSETTVAGTAQVTVFGGPLVPLKVSWQAGLAREIDGGADSPWRGSLGLGVAVAIPAVAVSVRPWVAPRIDYLGDQPVSGSRFKGAVSGGIDVGLLSGLGFRLGYDSRLGWEDGTVRASGISFGISYRL